MLQKLVVSEAPRRMQDGHLAHKLTRGRGWVQRRGGPPPPRFPCLLRPVPPLNGSLRTAEIEVGWLRILLQALYGSFAGYQPAESSAAAGESLVIARTLFDTQVRHQQRDPDSFPI